MKRERGVVFFSNSLSLKQNLLHSEEGRECTGASLDYHPNRIFSYIQPYYTTSHSVEINHLRMYAALLCYKWTDYIGYLISSGRVRYSQSTLLHLNMGSLASWMKFSKQIIQVSRRNNIYCQRLNVCLRHPIIFPEAGGESILSHAFYFPCICIPMQMPGQDWQSREVRPDLQI